MSATGRGSERRERDFYPTPPEATRLILPHIPYPRTVLEPACGSGHIMEQLIDYWPLGCEIHGIEIDGSRVSQSLERFRHLSGVNVVEADFLGSNSWNHFDLIVTNPPFSLAQEFVEHSCRFADRAVMLLPLNFLASAGRKAFWRKYPANVYVLPKRPSFVHSLKCTGDCGWRDTEPADLTREKRIKVCPECDSKISRSKTDSLEYAWYEWRMSCTGEAIPTNRWSRLDAP
jgi:predicted RNA methylase